MSQDNFTHLGLIVIQPDGDLLLKAIEYNYEIERIDGDFPILAEASFKVSRKKLLDRKCAPNIRTQLQNLAIKSISIERYSIGAIELWMRCFHGVMTDDIYELPIKDVWNAIAFGRESEFDRNDLKGWPAKYFSKVNWGAITLDDIKKLIYPAYVLKDVRTFAIATKSLSFLLPIGSALHAFELSAAPRFSDLHVPTKLLDLVREVIVSMRMKVLHVVMEASEFFIFPDNGCQTRAKCIASYKEAVEKSPNPLGFVNKFKSIMGIMNSTHFIKEFCDQWDTPITTRDKC